MGIEALIVKSSRQGKGNGISTVKQQLDDLIQLPYEDQSIGITPASSLTEHNTKITPALEIIYKDSARRKLQNRLSRLYKSALNRPSSSDTPVFAPTVSPSVDLRLTLKDPVSLAKATFLAKYPEYVSTQDLDHIRTRYYTRLDKGVGHVYLDYTGSGLYPSHLIDWHQDFLRQHVLGNTHSDSPAATFSTTYEKTARKAILDFVDADPEIYDVILTSNATAGLKLVGECYECKGKRIIIGMDSHNSVNGLAVSARNRGAKVSIIPFNLGGGVMEEQKLFEELDEDPPDDNSPGLVVFTGQSNITGLRSKPSWYNQARKRGWHVGIDAAALAPSCPIFLRQNPVDFISISIYKIIGYPTGVGALIVAKSFLPFLRRQSFFGGTVDDVALPTFEHTLKEGHEAFEDGTINFLALPAVVKGLEFVRPLIPLLSTRNGMLRKYVVEEISKIKYETGMPLVQIPNLGNDEDRGSTLSLVFNTPELGGDGVGRENYRFIIWAAALRNISLRGGDCLCNPGAASYILGMDKSVIDVPRVEFLRISNAFKESGRGIVRVSLGLASNFEDCYRFLEFCRDLAVSNYRQKVLEEWKSSIAA